MYTGPKLITDSLAFGFDSGYGVADKHTSTIYYKGEPATNLRSATQTSGIIQGMSGISIAHVGEENGYQKYSMNGTFNGGTYPYIAYLKQESFTASVKYSTQAKVKTNVPGKFNYFGSNGVSYVNVPMDHSGSLSSTLQDDGCYLVKREGFAYSSTTSQPGYLWTNPINGTTFSSSTDFIYVKDFQIEQNDHCTPHTATSRGNNDSLIDLTKTVDISVANTSFDSTGQPTFDGTDDHIETGLTRGDLGDSFTLIAYYKYTGNSSRTYTPIFGGHESSGAGTEFFIGKNTSNTNIGVQDGNYSGSFVTGSNAWDGNYHQIVYTYQLIGSSSSTNGTGKIYLDGVLKNTGSFTKCNTGENIRIGHEAESGGYRFLGDIPRVCIFKRAFTAEEVLEDFNANKKRFNI